MSTENMTSREARLNALADGELDATETELLLEQLQQDPGMQKELCDIHQVKDMLRYAYPENTTEKSHAVFRRQSLAMVAAGFLVFILGGLSSYLFIPANDMPFTLSQAQTQSNKVLLFVGFSDETHFIKTLDKAENLLKRYQQTDIEVTIVASGGGIDMLRDRISPYQQRIHSLSRQYDHLDFVACNSTLERLRRKGRPVDLVDEAMVAPSAVEFVVGRLKEGWSYVAI